MCITLIKLLLNTDHESLVNALYAYNGIELVGLLIYATYALC